MIILALTTVFACLATAIMSYIAMATATGPWIEPTLVLFGALILRVVSRSWSPHQFTSTLGLATAGGALGGIMATAVAWAFPTLYFLDKSLFVSWLVNPWYFCTLLSAIVLSAALLGLVIATIFEESMLRDEQMPFPIGELVYKMIAAQNQVRKSLELAFGVILAILYGVAQTCWALIPKVVKVGSWLTLNFDLLPMFWAIGFVTGHVIAIPLAVGVITKLAFMNPVHGHFFAHVSSGDFLMAFISGLVLQGAMLSFIEFPKMVTKAVKRFMKSSADEQSTWWAALPLYELGAGIIIISAVLWYVGFSLIAQVYIVLATFVCTYQLLIIAGKTGLAPFPRFATFVMMPGLFLFGFDYVQITMVSVFVEVCGGVAVDILFGRKMARLAHIPRRSVVVYQFIGLLVSAIAIGIVFWLLISHFGLGTPELVAGRAQGRALLVKYSEFNIIVMLIGALYGLCLKFIHVNPTLVLGGLAMPIDLSLMLIGGGMSTYLVKDREEYYPFWSGIFAASSLWMLVRAFQ